MEFNKILYKIYSFFYNKKGRAFGHNKLEVEKFLNRFPEPKDDIERSFFQYKCQKWDTIGKLEFLVSNLVSLFCFLPEYYKCKNKVIKVDESVDAVLTMEFIKDYLPDDFKGKFCVANFYSGSLNLSDMRFIRNVIKKHPFSFLFNYKVMCRIASYSEVIRKYNPKSIIASAEYSYTSSILTYYCEKNGVEHLNVMHGEKLLLPRDAFSRFSKFYVWDSYYIHLMKLLKSDRTQYIIQRIRTPNIVPLHDNKKCTYYLQLHTKKQLLRIKEILEKIDLEYLVRIHPVHLTRKEVEDIFGIDHVEDAGTDVWDSIENAGYVIAQDSTVLYQAYMVGARVVIDDISDPEYYNRIKDLGYIMLSKPHFLLSTLLKKRL